MQIINSKLITENEIRTGFVVVVKNDRIEEITDMYQMQDGDTILDAKGQYLSPGFVDIHCHGGGGADFMDGSISAFETACKTHLQHGTTTIVPTSVASSENDLKNFSDAFRGAVLLNDMPRMPGVHLEGPFLAPEMTGAIDPHFLLLPSKEIAERIMHLTDGILLRWTIAPELAGACELGSALTEKKIYPSIGHSNGYYEDAERAVKCGFRTVTHIYSSMSTIRRENGFRRPGILEAALMMDELFAEVIADGKHLPPELLRLVHRAKGKGRMILVTDAMRAAGTNAKTSVLGSMKTGSEVIIEDGVAKLPDRSSFAGSIATADLLVKTMHEDAGIGLAECIRMMTYDPAKAIGLEHETGKIAPGYKADLIIFDEKINISTVVVNGNILYGYNKT